MLLEPLLFPFGLLLPLALVALIVVAVVALAGGRGEPDPRGHRPYAVYLFVVTFAALFLAVAALFAAASALLRIPFERSGEHCVETPFGVRCEVIAEVEEIHRPEVAPAPEGAAERAPLRPGDVDIPPPPPEPVGGWAVYGEAGPGTRHHVREAVQAGLVAIAAGLVLWFHVRRGRDLVAEPGFAEGPAYRTYRTYLFAVCFVAVVVGLAAAVAAAFGLFHIAAPGIAGFAPADIERERGLHQFLSSALLAAVAVWLFLFHWRRAAPRGTAGDVATEPGSGV